MTKKYWQINDALARLSTLQGSYTPPHRFDAHIQNISENSTENKTHDLILRKWLSVYPEGIASKSSIDLDLIHESTLDLKNFLWIENDSQNLLIIRGLDNKGHAIAESSDLNHEAISLQHLLLSGEILELKTEIETDATQLIKKPVSATDWFIHVIGKRRKQLFDSILATIVINTLAVGTAMYSMQVYDRVVPSQSNSTLIVLTIGVLIAIILELILKQLRAKLVDESFKEADLELSAVFFNKALGIRLDARPKNVGTFVSEIRSFESIRAFATSATLFVLADAPFALFFIFVMMAVGGLIGLIPLIFIIIMLVAGFVLTRKLHSISQELTDENNRKNGFLIECMDGIESIKAAAGEVQLSQTWQKINQSQAPKELAIKDVTQTTNIFTSGIQQIAYISTVAVGALLIHQGQLTMGGLIACTILSGRTLGPLMQIPQLLLQWGQLKVSLEKLNNIMGMPSDHDVTQIASAPENSKNRLTMENIVFQYSKEQVTLTIPQLKIEAGQTHFIMGRVGSGKSTLLKLLSGLYKPNSGRVFLDNLDISHLSPGFIREKIGYLPQDVRLIKGTLKDNLTLGLPYASDQQILEAAAKVGLDRLIQRHPAGLNLPIAEGGIGLSGGQRQMVALARLFLIQPDILLLDEPTASLDGDLENKVMHELSTWMSNEKLLIIISHKPNLLKNANFLTIIDNGKILQSGERDLVLNFLKEQRKPTNS